MFCNQKIVVYVISSLCFFLCTPIGHAQACSNDALSYTLRLHDKTRIEFRFKMKTGYISRGEALNIAFTTQRHEILEADPRYIISAIQYHLESLDRKHRTSVLIYAPQGNKYSGCVWLIGPKSISTAMREENGADASEEIRGILDDTNRVETRLPTLRRDSLGTASDDENIIALNARSPEYIEPYNQSNYMRSIEPLDRTM